MFKKWEVEAATNELKELFSGKDKRVFVTVLHVSRSGMYRALDVFVMRDNAPRRITHTVARALDWKYDKRHEGVGTSGCGMDMTFNLVYCLSNVLFAGEGIDRAGYILQKENL